MRLEDGAKLLTGIISDDLEYLSFTNICASTPHCCTPRMMRIAARAAPPEMSLVFTKRTRMNESMNERMLVLKERTFFIQLLCKRQSINQPASGLAFGKTTSVHFRIDFHIIRMN